MAHSGKNTGQENAAAAAGPCACGGGKNPSTLKFASQCDHLQITPRTAMKV